MAKPALYLLHFSPPLKHARHYLGFVKDGAKLEERLSDHRRGFGAKITRACVVAGIDMILSRVWKNGSRTMERQLKRRKEAPTFCPICRAEKDEQ